MDALAPAPDRVAGSAVVERLTALHPKLIDLSTGRIERLLARMGDPHLALPNVIHVAGTNGKGSTVAFLRAGLEAAGLRVNVYTSPHLVRFTERIVLAGREIEEGQLLSVLERCEAANAGAPITFFEILTAAAFVAFAEAPADATVIEVGLGGRYDATNVFPAPAVAAIAPVSIDHVEFLGGELGQIAWEKAGILKSGRPAVAAPQSPAAADVIRAEAAKVGADLALGDAAWRVLPTTDGFRFQDGPRAFDLPAPALAGSWQFGNAGLALAALGRLEGFELTAAVAEAAMRNVRWPARLQRLIRGPLATALGGRALWLDGGHNPAAAAALATTLAAWPEPPRLILGMVGTKDVSGYMNALKPVVERIETVPVPEAATPLAPEDLADAARLLGLEARAHASVEAAVAAVAAARGREPVLIAGSLYLAGYVLRTNG